MKAKETKGSEKNGKDILSEVRNAYCSFCSGKDVSIIMSVKATCRKCGKTRLITRNIKPDYGK